MKLSCLSNSANPALLFVLINCYVAQLTVAQQSPGQGGFRFVNAAGIPSKVFLTIDGKKMRPEGFDSGNTTGAIGILVGTHRFGVSSPSNGTAEIPVSVQPNSSATVIAYCKTIVDPRTRQPTQILQLLSRPNPPRAHGKQFQLLYLSGRPMIDLTINGQSRSVSALRELLPAELPAGQIKIEYTGKPVVTFDAPQSGNFLV